MSYKLADGSMSTDYKIGDEFTRSERGSVFSELHKIRGLSLGNPVKTPKHTALIKSIRETMQYLERTIQELES